MNMKIWFGTIILTTIVSITLLVIATTYNLSKIRKTKKNNLKPKDIRRIKK